MYRATAGPQKQSWRVLAKLAAKSTGQWQVTRSTTRVPTFLLCRLTIAQEAEQLFWFAFSS
jgi:hypothetical protein